MQLLFSYLSASQTIVSKLSQSVSQSSTEYTSFRLSVSSQSDSISVGVSLTPSPDLSLTTRVPAITELSSQDAPIAASLSSFETQNVSSSMSESITFFKWVSELIFGERTRTTNKQNPLPVEWVKICLWSSQWVLIRRAKQEVNQQELLLVLKARQKFRKYRLLTQWMAGIGIIILSSTSHQSSQISYNVKINANNTNSVSASLSSYVCPCVPVRGRC